MNEATRILDAVRELAPAISARRAEIESLRRLPADLLKDLIALGCFRMLTPKSHGGYEIDFLASMEILEQLAIADGAVAWTVMIGCETPILFALLPRHSFDAIYASGPDVIAAGGFAPQGEARAEERGYRVSGRWAFASGCQHASWLLGNCVVSEGGRPRSGPTGPEVRAMVFPARAAEILDTWKVAGMRGTGSHDIVVKDVFVPAEYSLDIFFGQSSVAGPLFKFPALELSMHIAAVAIGIAQGALDELVKFIGTKKVRLYAGASLADTPVVHHRVGQADTMLRAARALLRSEAQRMWRFALDGATPDLLALAMRTLGTNSWVARTCAAIVDSCFTVGGGQAIYESSSLQSRLRDIHTLTQHASLNEAGITKHGALLLGQPVRFGY